MAMDKFRGLAKDAAKSAGKLATTAVVKGGKEAGKIAVQTADQEAKKTSQTYSDMRDAYDKSKKAAKAAKKSVDMTIKTIRAAKGAPAKIKAALTAMKGAIQAGAATVKGAIAALATPAGWVVLGVGLLAIILFKVAMAMDTKAVEEAMKDDQIAVVSDGQASGQVNDVYSSDKPISDDQFYVLMDEDCPDESDSDSSSSMSGSDAMAAGEDWTVPGTQAYKNAEHIFKAFVDSGTSGAFAAGVVGWINSEGGFAMVGRAEGHYGNDPKTNSIKYGVVPVGLSYYTTAAGGGIFQFTPYTKYAPLGSDDWEDIDKMVNFVIKQVANGDWNAAMDMTRKNHSFEQAVQLTDPEEATLTWQAYERGNEAYIKPEQKKSDARKAYNLFDGGKYKYNEKRFKEVFGSASGANTSGGSSSDSDSDSEGCSSESSGGGASWGEADGTGEVNHPGFSMWKPDQLPSDLKKYAIDPESVDMKYASTKGWHALASTGGQCTDLSASLMYAIWEKDGEHPTQRMGNGRDVVSNWVSAFGGKESSTPHAGSVFSSSWGSRGEHPTYGHTGVVSHVFKNGDILIIEQNVGGFSGDENGTPHTWNYTYLKKKDYDGNLTFFDPSSVGYSFTKGIKSAK